MPTKSTKSNRNTENGRYLRLERPLWTFLGTHLGEANVSTLVGKSSESVRKLILTSEKGLFKDLS